MRRLPVLALALAASAGCTASALRPAATSTAPSVATSVTTTPAPTATVPRIAVVVMENREYDRVVGNPAAPYVNGLARRYALATASFAISHPSLPNYLALTGGSTFGVASDCTGCHVG